MTTLTTTVVGLDTETDRLEGQNVLPEIVCTALASGDVRALRAHVEPEMRGDIEAVLSDESIHIVCHNAAFDLGVICRTFPDLIPMVFAALAAGRVSCCIIREKLLHLTSHGGIEFAPLPGGETEKLDYKLASLVARYFGVDISASKEGDDQWRVNYAELRGIPAAEYPSEAYDYAIDDGSWPERIWHAQEELRAQRVRDTTIDPFEVEPMRVSCDFALQMMSAWGMMTDSDEYLRVKSWLDDELQADNLKHLIDEGILRPATPPRPYKNKATNPDGTPKMTKGEPESIDQKRMRQLIRELKEAMPDDVTIKMTKPSKKFPKGQLSFDAEWLEDHFHLAPWLEEYRHRQKLQKLVTTELPRMCLLDDDGNHTDQVAPVVHPCYDVLKRTGRTSSFASKTYPSFNCQNVDPRVRRCYVPRPGYLFFSIDYSGMELGTLGQQCLNLFGKSVLADKINAGVDAHGYLAASIAYNVDDDFKKVCDDAGVTNTDDIYDCFLPLKTADDDATRDFFKHFRKLAKPTGLGYPGGLGAKTFVRYAKATYGLVIDLKMAELLRDIWHIVYPEMALYFDHINNRCIDGRNSPRTVKYIDDDGKEKTRQQDVYAYSTPMGLYRAGCDYCAAANGLGLQSPSAEGALTAVWNVVRCCLDSTMHSPLFDDAHGVRCRPICFIHDEIVGEVREDCAHECVAAMEEIMVAAMATITPDVTPRVESALMRRWDKRAEPVYDAAGKLTIWTPKEAA